VDVRNDWPNVEKKYLKKIDFGRVVKGGGGGGGRERLLPLWKFRESRVRVEESRSRRVPTDFFFFSLSLVFLFFLSTIFPFSAFLVHFSSWKIKGRPELNQRRSGSKKEEEKEEKKMEKKEEEEEEVDKNHATSPRLLTPAGVSSLSSLSFVTWPRFFFLPPALPPPTTTTFSSPDGFSCVRVCVCGPSVRWLLETKENGVWFVRLRDFFFFFSSFLLRVFITFCLLPSFRSFVCLPPVL
jgi:hypothetical protein